MGRRALAEGPRPRRCAQTDGRGVAGEVGGSGGRTHAGGGGVGVVTGPRRVRTTLESGRVVLGCRGESRRFVGFSGENSAKIMVPNQCRVVEGCASD